MDEKNIIKLIEKKKKEVENEAEMWPNRRTHQKKEDVGKVLNDILREIVEEDG